MYSSSAYIVRKEQLGGGADLADLLGGLQAVHAGHGNVEQGDVRPVDSGQVDRRVAVAGFGDDLDVGCVLQQGHQALPNHLVILKEYRTNLDVVAHVLTSGMVRNLIRNVVPAPTCDSRAIVPAKRCARSRMPVSPVPLRDAVQVHSLAVVMDQQLQCAFGASDLDHRLLGLRVADDICQGFLHDAIYRRLERLI